MTRALRAPGRGPTGARDLGAVGRRGFELMGNED
jgi:hypothetical protein